MGSLLAKLKTFFGHIVDVGDDEAHKIAEAALPLFDHFKQDVEGIVTTAVDGVKLDVEGLAAALKPVLKDALREVLTELGVGAPPAS
jgi:hypothetical protein